MDQNQVVLGDNQDLFTREFDAGEFNWIAMDPPTGDIRAKARIRYKHKEADATIVPTGQGTAHIIFDEPQRAITSGQSVVLYDGDYVVGGGTIL
ncbi:MAG: tRNA 2-thiouridine(34) synthase MnmA, partial [Eubacteriales bacterium]|nr:tRNA 2-thiouridine(34) synthase MnmA [Eubacteriales bacterium]